MTPLLLTASLQKLLLTATVTTGQVAGPEATPPVQQAGPPAPDDLTQSEPPEDSPTVKSSIKSLLVRSKVTAPENLEAPPNTQVLPPKDPNIKDKLEVVNADDVDFVGDDFTAVGNVEILYQGYRLKADKIEGNRATQIVQLTGNSTVEGIHPDEVVSGQTIIVKFKEKIYEFADGKSTIVPQRTQGQTTGKFYATGGGGSLNGQHFHLSQGTLTSCDLPHPHYVFHLKSGDLDPGKKLILREVDLNILGHKVLSLPYLYIPLLDDRPRYLPEFGQSQDEGYYVKSNYTTPLRGDDTLTSRLDLMSKLGVGIGEDWRYTSPVAEGGLGFYTLIGANKTLVANWVHRQLWGNSDLNLDLQYNRNNYLTAPQSSTLNGRAQLVVPNGNGSTSFGYFRSGSDTSGFSSVNQSYSLTDNRNFGRFTRTNITLNYNDALTTSSGTLLSSSRLLDVNFLGTQEFRSFTADLGYRRAVPAGGNNNFSGSGDQTPMLTLTSDGSRLFGNKIGRNWPFRFESSVGELQDFSSQGNITRIAFDTALRRQEKLTNSTTLSWDGQYKQGLYSDDTAQYVLNYGGNLTQTVGRSSLNLNYRRRFQRGFTPLAIDYSGRSDAFNFNAVWDFGQGWGATAQTGYDLLSIERSQTPWQLLTVGANYRGAESRFTFGSVYDTYNQSWSTLRADGEWSMLGARFAGGIRYDGLRSTWAAASLQAQALKLGRITVDMLLNYNGYTKQFDSQQYSIAYDLHCADAVFEITDFKTGFRSGRQFAFFIRLKALPFGSDFGFGRQGQRIGGGVGGYGG